MSSITKPMLLDSTGKQIVEALKSINDTLGGKTIIYGFHIDGNESDPSSAVTYLRDAVGMTPAYMDYDNDVFNWGTWGDAFFIPRPCMVKSNGTVDYYLDPSDYTKKMDGTASDVADTSYDGNAMMEWGDGSSKIWMKIVADSDDAHSGSVFIANYKADANYHCYPFINSQGTMIDHFYTPIYNGSLIDSKLRSMSGQTEMQSKNASQEITYAKNNYNSTYPIWNTECWADISLINNLLILISKSLDSQTAFGQGNVNSSYAATNLCGTGTMDTKGMFWGAKTSASGDKVGVKVFGMENWWGNQWRRFAGLINDNGNIKVKLTYGMEDGSTAEGYNITGEGYISTGLTPSGASGGYISKSTFTTTGVLPVVASGSATTYFADGLWFNNSQVDYACLGGDCGDGAHCGVSYLGLAVAASGADWSLGAAPSLKPLS